MRQLLSRSIPNATYASMTCPLLTALLAFTLLLAPTARAEGPANPLDRNGGPGQAPAQQQAPPDWVVPGARITESFIFSSGLKEPKPEQVSGTAGSGFTQYDIVAVTPDGVVIQSHSYSVYEPGQPPELSGTNIALVDFATGGSLWMRPAEIAATQASNDPAALVTREALEIGGETYEALIFQTRQGNTMVRKTYDVRTGIRLSETVLTEDSLNRSHQAAEYAGYRVAELPWFGTEFTPQVQGLNKLTFEGAMIFISPQTPGIERMPDLELDFDAEFAFDVVTPQLIGVTVTFDIDMHEGPNQTNERREPSCPGQRLGLFIHPDVLSQLERGQVLDEDPAIGYRITVTDVYEVQGVTMVEITEQGRGNGYYMKITYDARVGLQVASEWTQPAMNQRIEAQLERVE